MSSNSNHRPPPSPADCAKPIPSPDLQNRSLAIEKVVSNVSTQSDAVGMIDPSLVAKITEQVIYSLRSTDYTAAASPNSQHIFSQCHSNSEPQSSSYQSSSISIDTSLPSRTIYTPPSPAGQACRIDEPSEPQALIGASKSSAAEGNFSHGESGRSAPVAISKAPHMSQAWPRRFSEASDLDRETPVERIWQALFDSESRPTQRLSQFLRGLANHIIKDFEPKQNIVITPNKMLDFYKAFSVPDEYFPWDIIFGSLSNDAISKIYRGLRCTHHFVQASFHGLPSIPALTPCGFERWTTLMIEANPDIEHARLKSAVLHIPISNADDVRERFPKELPRRLFPRSCNLYAQQRCAAALAADPIVQLPKHPPFPPPPSSLPISSISLSPTAKHEPEVYFSRSRTLSACSSYEVTDVRKQPLIPIERERKPYSAQPGSGKIHNNECFKGPTQSGSIAGQPMWW